MVDSVASQLGRVELFSALHPDDLEAIAELAQRRHYRRGDVVYRQGDLGRGCYLVEHGRLRSTRVDPDGVSSEIRRLFPGDFVGEGALLLGRPHDATVEVIEDAALLTIDKVDFDRLLTDRPSVLDELQMSSEVSRRRCAPRFSWQEPGEIVVFVLRKHNVILLHKLLVPGLALLIILTAFFLLQLTSTAGLIIGGVLSAVPLSFTLYQVVDHFNDRYILTNKRVIHDEHVYLIHRSRVEAPLGNIQSIQRVQQGMLARSFGFGDLLIETAGEPGGLVKFRQIADPTAVQEQIFEEKDRLKARARAEERAVIQEALHRRLGPRLSEGDATVAEDEQQPTEERSSSRLASWARAPLRVARYFFPALRCEEGDTVTWRKHWVALLGPISRPTGVIALVTLVTGWLLGRDTDHVSVLFSYAIVLVFLVPWWLWVFEDWQNDIYQVSGSRIVDIEQLPLGLKEERREASLDMIQNVSLSVPGLIGRLLGYGLVRIETAGAGAFTFDYVKDPEGVQREIFRRIEMFEERERQKRARRRRDELLDWFAVYDQMRHPEDQQGDGPVLPTRSPGREPSDTSPSS